MNIKKYTRKEEIVEIMQFNGKNTIECIRFAEPNKTDKKYMQLAHARSVYSFPERKFMYLLIGEEKIQTKIGDIIVKSNFSGISVFSQEKFNEGFAKTENYKTDKNYSHKTKKTIETLFLNNLNFYFNQEKSKINACLNETERKNMILKKIYLKDSTYLNLIKKSIENNIISLRKTGVKLILKKISLSINDDILMKLVLKIKNDKITSFDFEETNGNVLETWLKVVFSKHFFYDCYVEEAED